MELLGQEEKKKSNNGKKVVLTLLIVSIIVFVILICLIIVLSKYQGPKTDMLFIDDIAIEITQDLMISDENNKYIALQEIANKIGGHVYYSGEYKKYVEDKNKCYIENPNEVIGFEGGTNKIYKTTGKSITDYEYYDLTSKIINFDNKLYINVEDIQKAFSIGVNYQIIKDKIEIKIYTMDFLETYYTSKLAEIGGDMLLSTEYNNKKMMADGMIVVSLNGKYGVLDGNLETKIEKKYNAMLFNEYTESFIVTISDNKMGVIDINGKIKIEPQYDGISTINHSPVLYEVKINDKVGVLKEDGSVLVNIGYDKLGCEGNPIQNTKSVLIIPNIKNNQSGIVVSKDNKYGIINIVTGKEATPCDLDKIYSKVSQSTDEVQYFVKIKDTDIDLQQYLDYINTLTVNVNS